MARRPNSKRVRRPIDRPRGERSARESVWQRIRRWWRVIRTGF
ncbi:hypothetical protein [Sphingomonas sp. Leaf37]|nr:hypothetical protein [Sphingomonas sp. Leaf37]